MKNDEVGDDIALLLMVEIFMLEFGIIKNGIDDININQ
jgi:hypothetical protein